MNLYGRVLRYIVPYWRHVAVSIVCMTLYAFLSGASIWLIAPFIKVLFVTEQVSPQLEKSVQIAQPIPGSLVQKNILQSIKQKLKSKTNALVIGNSHKETIKRLCILICLVMFLKNVFDYLQGYLLISVEQGVVKRFRDELYTHLHSLSLDFYHNNKIGHLISRLTNDVQLLNETVRASITVLFRDPLLLLLYLSIIIILSWKLALVALLVIPFSLIIITQIGIKLRKYSTRSQEKMANINSVIQETVTGIRVVKAFNMEVFEIGKFMRENNLFYKIMLKMTRVSRLAAPMTEFLGTFVGVAILWYGGNLVLEDKLLAPDEFVAFLLAVFAMMQPLKKLSNVNNDVQKGLAAADRIFMLLDTKPSTADVPRAQSVVAFKHAISFNNVSFSYNSNKDTTLNNISFTINAGEIVAFVGPSGAGKSTLMDLLIRFYNVTDGTILLDGVDIQEISMKSLRSLMGIVTQDTILFNDSIKNNIAYGLSDIPQKDIENAAEVANIKSFIETLPEGYDTVVGDRGLKLSGGERQRLAIARAILKNPQILIFDEATSSLDTQSEQLVQKAISKLILGRTSLVIAHRLSTIKHATKIIVIDKGSMAESGTHGELLAHNGLYKKLYDLQFQNI